MGVDYNMENSSLIFSDTLEIVNIIMCAYVFVIGRTNCLPNPLFWDSPFLQHILSMDR